MTAPALRLVNTETGEVTDSCPGCAEKDETIAALQAEVGRQIARSAKLQKQVHRDLGLEPKAAQVENVYAEYVRVLHPKTRKKKVPADRLKMGLARAEEFSEEEMVRAVHGARERRWITNRDTGEVYDEWENIFRSFGHTRRYIKYADRAEAERRREMPLGMQILDVLRTANRVDVKRSTETRVHADCPSCGGGLWLDVRSGTTICQAACEQEAVDATLVKLAAAHGLPLGGGQ